MQHVQRDGAAETAARLPGILYDRRRVRAFAEWLYGTAPSVAVHSTLWLIRLLQATHLLTAGVVAGSGVMIALRAVGWLRADEPFETVWRRFAPWLVCGLAVMVSTGIAQTLGDPVREFTATSYWVKLAAAARLRGRHVCCSSAPRGARRRRPISLPPPSSSRRG